MTGLDGPDSTVELAEDEWTQAVQRSRSIDLELCTHKHVYTSGWEVASYIIQLACRWKHVRRKHVTSQQGVRRVVKLVSNVCLGGR